MVVDLFNFRAKIRNILIPNESKNHKIPETRKPLYKYVNYNQVNIFLTYSRTKTGLFRDLLTLV